MSKTKDPYRSLAKFWALFIGIGAVGGAIMMFSDPSDNNIGLHGMLVYFQALPFADIFFTSYLIPGILLLVLNGFTNFASFALIVRRHKFAPISAIACGTILFLWIMIQFAIFPLNFMTSIYGVFAVLQITNGVLYLKNSRA